MAFLPLRLVPLPEETETLHAEWLSAVDRALDDPAVDRNELCRELLEGLYGVEPGSGSRRFGAQAADFGFQAANSGARPGVGATHSGLDPALTRAIALSHLDPRQVTLEPEYYREIDEERYAAVKPLLWLWEMFDRSPVGENIALGVRFRRLLARRIFRRCGRNFKAFPYVRMTFGYNLDVGDDVVVHRHALLDDRGGIELHDGCSISDFANIYSHTHDIVDGREVHNRTTVIGRGVRITYHATVLAGVQVRPDAMVGAGAILTRDADEGVVHVGVPARPVKRKDPEALARRARATPDPLADDRATTLDEAGEG